LFSGHRFVEPARLLGFAAAAWMVAWVPAPGGAAVAAQSGTLTPEQAAARLQELPLPAGSRHAAFGSGLFIDGIPVAVRIFQAPAPVDAVLRGLAPSLPAHRDLLLQPGAALLSWRSGGWHWVVRLSREGGGTHGALSAMAEQPAAAAPQRFAWMPPGARVLLDICETEAGRQVDQQVLAHAWPPDRLVPAIARALERAGWRRRHAIAAKGGIGRWTRAGMQLVIHLAPLERGSGLTVRRLSPPGVRASSSRQ